MIAIINNSTKDTASFLNKLIKQLNITTLPYKVIGDYPRTKEEQAIIKQATLLLILGGDGTVLSTLQESGNHKQFILAINFGTLGYISDVNAEESLNLLPEIIKIISDKQTCNKFFSEKKAGLREMNKNYSLIFDRRATIACTTTTPTTEAIAESPYFALNEIAIKPANLGRPMHITTVLNNTPLCNFLADGALVATPTGSTAYNLSAGGPIVSSNVNALIFNAICPHSISMKPLVVHGEETMLITSNLASYVLCDGNESFVLKKEQTLYIKKKQYSPIFIHSNNYNRYQHLKKKLNWG